MLFKVGTRCRVSTAQRRSIHEPLDPLNAVAHPTAAEHRGPTVGRFRYYKFPHLRLRVKNLFSLHIDCIYNADNYRIHRRALHIGSEPCAASLTEKHHLAQPRTNAIHGHNGIFTGLELRRILIIDQLGTQQQQLTSRHGGILLGGNHRSFDSCEKHARFYGLGRPESTGQHSVDV